MIAPITISHIDVFDEIVKLDLGKCVISVCMASVLKDEAMPRFERVQISEKLAGEFKEIIRNRLERFRPDTSPEEYLFAEFAEQSTPTAYEIEHLGLSEYTEYENILKQISPLGALTDIDVYDNDEQFISGLRFYVIVVQPPSGESIFFFHSYQHRRMLGRSLIFAICNQTCYDRITEPVLVFDQEIDCMSRGDIMFVFDKPRFQGIFQFFEEIHQVAKGTLEAIKLRIPIKNFQDLVQACEGDLNKLRKLKNIASKPYLSEITIEDIERIIEQNNLPLKIVDVDGQRGLFYDPKAKNKWLILKVLDDDYLKSLMTQQNYDAPGKREVQKKHSKMGK